MTGSSSTVISNPKCLGKYSFIKFKASAVCFTSPLKTGKYVGIKTTKKQQLQLCEVEVYSRGNSTLILNVIKICMLSNYMNHEVCVGEILVEFFFARSSVCKLAKKKRMIFACGYIPQSGPNKLVQFIVMALVKLCC